LRVRAAKVDAMVASFGAKDSLLLEVDWAGEVGATSADATRGSLRLWANGEEVWPGGNYELGFEWTWVELAEFLAGFWPWLMWENGLPFDLQGGSIQRVRVDLQRRWSLLSMAVREVEEEDFFSFLERHDLARGISGAVAPSVWIIREGNDCWISTEDGALLARFKAVQETLSSFVEVVLARLDGVEDARAEALRTVWESRLAVDSEQAVSIVTGLDQQVVAELQGDQDPAGFWEFDENQFEITELMAAARLSAALPTSDAAKVLDAVRSTPRHATPKLDDLAPLALDELPVGPEWYPYDQGYFVADWLRRRLEINTSDPADPENLLKRWGVSIGEVSLGTDAVDAIACWGPRHGPTVFLNKHGSHNRSEEGRRATYAHEIAHLLLDRTQALPLAEVIGGRAVGTTEERARAFAAQLLLPKDEAGAWFASSSNPERTVRELRKHYGVSYEIIAWQARNSSVELPAKARSILRRFVSQPWRF
jgi:Zn-dependent peptidase ImmA (M78 family)